MRAISHERVEKISITVTPVMVLTVVIFIFCMAVLMIFRQQCINEGYAIDKLARELDVKSLKYEHVAQKYSDALRWESLYSRAEEMDFVFPVGGKVFYVEQ